MSRAAYIPVRGPFNDRGFFMEGRQLNPDPAGAVIVGDAFVELPRLGENSIDFVVTDPPYFLDGLGSDWDRKKLDRRRRKAGVIGALPVGMKFSPEQGRNFESFMSGAAAAIYRVLKPGGFFVCFSCARLYHRMAVAVEDAGFEIRDMLAWKYGGQAKAFSVGHFVRKAVRAGKMTLEEASVVLKKLGGRKTPQLRPQIDPMVLAQKPRDGTFVDNWLKWGVGLIDVSQTLDGGFPGNVMDVRKPERSERGEGNLHLTVKPVALIEHLVRLFTTPGQIVLDPFAGSGSHGVAAVRAGRRFLGIEIDPTYAQIARKRLEEVSDP